MLEMRKIYHYYGKARALEEINLTIKEGALDEVEPVGMAIVNINSIVDMFPRKHNLPKEQK